MKIIAINKLHKTGDAGYNVVNQYPSLSRACESALLAKHGDVSFNVLPRALKLSASGCAHPGDLDFDVAKATDLCFEIGGAHCNRVLEPSDDALYSKFLGRLGAVVGAVMAA